jgi:PAS domain S-box-containing protein
MTAKILLVDAQQSVVDRLSAMLVSAGYLPFGATHPAQGLELLNTHHPSILILDEQLPDDQSLRLCRQVRSDHRTADMCIILTYAAPGAPRSAGEERTTAHFEASARAEAGADVEAFADGFIRKEAPAREWLALIGTFLRLTKAQQLQVSRLPQAQHLQEISRFVPGALYQFKLEAHGKISFPYFSSNLEQLYGISSQVLFEDPELIYRVVHPDDLPAFSQSIQLSAATLSPWQCDYRVFKPNGESIMWIRGQSIPRLNPDGSILWNGIMTDITDIKKTENTLRIFSRAIESAAEGIVITDPHLPDNPIIFANEKFCRDTGYSREEIEGKNCRFLQGRETDPNTVAAIRTALRNHQPFTGEILNYRKDGTSFWNLLVVAPVKNQAGKTTHFVGLLCDVTDQKQARQQLQAQNAQLRKINAELDRFVYSVSHELRAPLTSVMGLITLAREEAKEPDIQEYLRLMDKAVRRLDQSSKSILDHARNARTAPMLEQIDLRELVEETFANQAYLEGAAAIHKQVQSDLSAPCYSDRLRLTFILRNIISNAIKYRNPEAALPAISVQLTVTASQITIVIEDNGMGIPEEHLSRIFDMFYRATQQKEGAGLGLFIVRESVEKLRGTIGVSSRIGWGTVFTITLPNQVPVGAAFD